MTTASFARTCAFSALLLGHIGTAAAQPIVISACGSTVPEGATGILESDLSCTPGSFNYVIFLGRGATLDLNGHTISNGQVKCFEGRGRCTVLGPGLLTGALASPQGPGAAIALPDRARLELRDVEIRNNETGVLGDQMDSSVHAVDSVIDDNDLYGIYAGKVILENVSASGNGVLGPGNTLLTAGIVAHRGLRGHDVTANDNVEGGVICGKPGKIRLQRLTAQNNTGPGVYSAGKGVKLIDSTVTGNTRDGENVDIRSFRLPTLVDTTCGYSASVPLDPPGTDDLGPPWGVCAND